MKLKLSDAFAFALCHVVLAAQPARAEQDFLNEFVLHPHYCGLLNGGPGYASDAVDATYAQALASTLTLMGGAIDLAISHLRLACAQRAPGLLIKESP